METVSALNAGSDPDVDWALRYADAVKALRLARDQVEAAEQAWAAADELVQDLLDEVSVD